MYTLTSSNCFENPLRLVVSCCVVFPCQAPVGSGFSVGPNGDNFWEIRTGRPILKITGKTQQTYDDELVCFPNLYFSIFVWKKPQASSYYALFLGLQSSKSYWLYKSVCFPNLQNLFLHQSSPTKSPTRLVVLFLFLHHYLGRWSNLTSILCQLCLNLNKNGGELVFFVGPVVWICRIPENESGIVT